MKGVVIIFELGNSDGVNDGLPLLVESLPLLQCSEMLLAIGGNVLIDMPYTKDVIDSMILLSEGTK